MLVKRDSGTSSEAGSGIYIFWEEITTNPEFTRTLFLRSRPFNLNDNVSVPFELLRNPR